MDAQFFRQLLLELDPQQAAKHSVINHHVDGMDYLCLHRAERLTVKLYFIDPSLITLKPDDRLVVPHTHRYAFSSTVLAGRLTHVVFRSEPGQRYERFAYFPNSRERVDAGTADLRFDSQWEHGAGESYFVDTRSIHTLLVPSAPVLLGLVQYTDVSVSSNVFLRPGQGMLYPQSRQPRAIEVNVMRERAVDALDSGVLSVYKPWTGFFPGRA